MGFEAHVRGYPSCRSPHQIVAGRPLPWIVGLAWSEGSCCRKGLKTPSSWCRPAPKEGGDCNLALSIPQMLKGCEEGLDPRSDDSLWMWLISVSFGVILMWESLKLTGRACVRAFSVGEPTQPVQVNVHVEASRTSSSDAGPQVHTTTPEAQTPMPESVEWWPQAPEIRYQGEQSERTQLLQHCASQPHGTHDGIRREGASEPKLWRYKR